MDGDEQIESFGKANNRVVCDIVHRRGYGWLISCFRNHTQYVRRRLEAAWKLCLLNHDAERCIDKMCLLYQHDQSRKFPSCLHKSAYKHSLRSIC